MFSSYVFPATLVWATVTLTKCFVIGIVSARPLQQENGDLQGLEGWRFFVA